MVLPSVQCIVFSTWKVINRDIKLNKDYYRSAGVFSKSRPQSDRLF